MYCKAFGAEITFEVRNDDKTAYAHCELSVDGEGLIPFRKFHGANVVRLL
jgi:uncharacterized glyoxalase superfamily protein PhnB